MSLGRYFYYRSKTVSLLNLSFEQEEPGLSHKIKWIRPYRLYHIDIADHGGSLRILLADPTQKGGARVRCFVRLVWL